MTSSEIENILERIKELRTEVAEYHTKANDQWTQMKPMLDVFNNLKGFRTTIMWIMIFVTAVAAAAGGLKELFSFIHK